MSPEWMREVGWTSSLAALTKALFSATGFFKIIE